MSDYQPKVGDRVMVGEHGPYEVAGFRDGWVYILGPSDQWSHALAHARTEWLTPAPEPEPDLPTTPGALVRDGKDDLLVLDADRDWMYLTGEYPGSFDSPLDITRPINVILNDPAEVETLRADRDELRRTIDRALNELFCIGGTVHRAVTILRGES